MSSTENGKTGEHQQGGDQHDEHQSHGDLKMYVRFGAMILTSMVCMYAAMFIGSWEWSHVRWSENRLFMTLTMGGIMGIVMLAWMLKMYRNTKANVAVVAISLLLLGGGAFLDRSQTLVQDTAYMSSMIPHHSLAITRSERAELDDVRVCQLAVEISEAQRREIDEMEWLIEDIERNGQVLTAEEAAARPIPDFPASALRDCAGE
ncbi:DUF305 domain-containing protein [Kocuria kalidii]|uniref:DUF305 domain-containing protein n=1 Tax=Kocuria kalidii TaxID=3376283 RepID=UPI00379CF01D